MFRVLVVGAEWLERENGPASFEGSASETPNDAPQRGHGAAAGAAACRRAQHIEVIVAAGSTTRNPTSSGNTDHVAVVETNSGALWESDRRTHGDGRKPGPSRTQAKTSGQATAAPRPRPPAQALRLGARARRAVLRRRERLRRAGELVSCAHSALGAEEPQARAAEQHASGDVAAPLARRRGRYRLGEQVRGCPARTGWASSRGGASATHVAGRVAVEVRARSASRDASCSTLDDRGAPLRGSTARAQGDSSAAPAARGPRARRMRLMGRSGRFLRRGVVQLR